MHFNFETLLHIVNVCYFHFSFLGFIGKGMTRAINRIWNYFFKGFIFSTAIIIFFPIICLAVSCTSIFLALTSPIWIPFSMVLLHLCMMLAYDLDSPNDQRNRYCILLEAIVWNILLQGCIQPIFGKNKMYYLNKIR